MSWVTAEPTRVIRSIADVLPVTAAAAGLGVSRFVSSPDDAKPRRLTGIWSSYTTKFLRFHLRIAGKLLMHIDANMISPTKGFLEVDQMYAGTVQFEYAIESLNPGGPAIAANTDEIIFRYETLPDTQTGAVTS